MKSKAIVLTEYNANLLRALLSLKTVVRDIGILQDDEVLIKLEAAPCNPSDIAFMRGGYNIIKNLPAIPGFEGAGTVIETGNESKALLGKRVSCFIQEDGDGTWSAFFRVKAKNCMVMKDGMETNQAACFSINPLTAYGMFELVRATGSKAMIQNAACGQVHGFMRVFARRHGIEVINLVRKEIQVQELINEGEKYVLNTASEDFFAQLKQLCQQLQPTIAFDATGGEAAGQILNAMPNGGQVVVYGALSGAALTGLDPMGIIFHSKSIRGFNLNDWIAGLDRMEFNDITDTLQEMFIAGELRTKIQATFALDQAIDGIKTYIKNMSAGKVLLIP